MLQSFSRLCFVEENADKVISKAFLLIFSCRFTRFFNIVKNVVSILMKLAKEKNRLI